MIQAYELYYESAKLFSQEKLYLEAAKSYYSAKKYQEAKINFEYACSYNEVGETIIMIINNDIDKSDEKLIQNHYEEAIHNFELGFKYNRALECCYLMKNTQKFIELLIKYRKFINKFNETYENNLKKYFLEVEADIKNGNFCFHFFLNFFLSVLSVENFENSEISIETLQIFQKFYDFFASLPFENFPFNEGEIKNKYNNIGKSNLIPENISPIILRLLFFCEYFKAYELGGLYSYSKEMKEYFMHFIYLKLISDPNIIDLANENTFIYFKNDSIRISLKISSNIFQKYLNFYLEKLSNHETIIYYICLIEPQVLFNIKRAGQAKINCTDLNWNIIYSKSDFDELFLNNFQEIGNIISNLIKNPENLFDFIYSKIYDDETFHDKYKNNIKPLFLLILNLTQLSFPIQNEKMNNLFVKMIMDTF